MKHNAVFTALKMNHTEWLTRIIDEGADINERREDGATPIMLAVCWQQAECVRLLLEGGADPDCDQNGFSPLMIAAQEDFVDIAALLVKKANVNYKGPYGLTPLMAAARDGHNEIVKLLLAARADAKTTTEQGGTALMMAKAFGHKETAELIEKHLGIFDYGVNPEIISRCLVMRLEGDEIEDP